MIQYGFVEYANAVSKVQHGLRTPDCDDIEFKMRITAIHPRVRVLLAVRTSLLVHVPTYKVSPKHQIALLLVFGHNVIASLLHLKTFIIDE
jgi:hypothetical protein